MKLPELTYAHELPDQFEQIGQGAQFAVYMLTDPALSQESTPDEQYVIPRVIKQALGRQAIASYVQEHIGITDPAEVRSKILDLELASIRVIWPLMYTAWDPGTSIEFPRTLGHPTMVLPDPAGMNPYDTSTSLGYTQDYVQPVSQLLAKLNYRRPAHRELAYDLVDQYVELEALLSRHGFFDVDFKLTDNCGVNEHGQLILLDFSELAMERSAVETVVEQAAWQQLPKRREYTQLPRKVQTYLNQRLAAEITPARLHDWASEQPDVLGLSSVESSYHLYDFAAQKIWWQRPGREEAFEATLRLKQHPELITQHVTYPGTERDTL